MTTRISDNGNFRRVVESVRSRVNDGIPKPTGQKIAQIMRFGPGSVSEQFASNRTDDADRGSGPWPSTKPFGTRQEPSRGLFRTGGLLSSWQGRQSDSITRITKGSVTIGVRSTNAAAVVFQREHPTVIRAKRRTRSGRLAMQLRLIKDFGVPISEAKLLHGIRVRPRPVAISKTMLDRAASAVLSDLTKGVIA